MTEENRYSKIADAAIAATSEVAQRKHQPSDRELRLIEDARAIRDELEELANKRGEPLVCPFCEVDTVY